jgi:hypothetical protein
MNAELLMLAGGIVAFALTIYRVRNRDMREKYAVAWIGLALLLLLMGIFPQVLERLAKAAHLSYPAAILFIALTAIYLFSFSVSLTLSRHHRQNMRLLQEIALLEHRLRLLESGRVVPNPNASTHAATSRDDS